MRKITGNKLFVKALKEEGVDILFGYPGACTIDISDELYKQDYTKVILPRHEQALVHAADAYARSTGKVGVCLVTSGPGATNLVTGIATANYDSVPLVCFTGQVARNLMHFRKLILSELQEVSANMELRYKKEKIWGGLSKKHFILQGQEDRDR